MPKAKMKREYGKLLSHHTSLKIGGPVFCWVEPENIDEFLEVAREAEAHRKTLTVIGRGSNILARDKGFDGIVVSLGRDFDYIEKEEKEILRVGAAVPLFRLLERCAEWGLGGAEFLSGIPGSFGGAIFMNAGVRDIEDPEGQKEIKDIILDIDVIDLKDKKRKTLERSDINFTYRSSGLEERCILGARIRLTEAEKRLIHNRIDSYMKKRKWIKDLQFPSAGSVFKNPDSDNPAARLIEHCHLKGKRKGQAEISRAHANFIVNTGGATSEDVFHLIKLARSGVKEKFGVDLELELKVI